MGSPEAKSKHSQPKRRYSWPWFVLLGIVLWIVLAIVWLNHEAKRIRRERDLNAPVRIGRDA